MLGLAAALVGTLYLAHLRTAVAGPSTVAAFRSGLPPREHAVSRFHVRWYAISLLFLAFDVEMLFMYPWAVVVVDVGTRAVVEMFVFLGLLMAGVVYAWREGALRWA
ncbi:NADH-quinone oxidoreductase subunit A [Micromonospora sp. WMMD729]|uniref:NADH-quinone oxidoreductase subunit A n=1 Tax=Micromonospora sp. WMMD729 TaxID=3404127 RepID=UPI003BF59F58